MSLSFGPLTCGMRVRRWRPFISRVLDPFICRPDGRDSKAAQRRDLRPDGSGGSVGGYEELGRGTVEGTRMKTIGPLNSFDSGKVRFRFSCREFFYATRVGVPRFSATERSGVHHGRRCPRWVSLVTGSGLRLNVRGVCVSDGRNRCTSSNTRQIRCRGFDTRAKPPLEGRSGRNFMNA